jgi:hypothetical protein
MPRFPIPAQSYAQLRLVASPQRADAPEAFADEIWDTQTFVNASTTQLTYFQSPSNDKTLTNIDASAQLAQPQYFVVHYVAVDLLFPDISTAATGVGNLSDVHKLINAARAIITFSVATKPYGPWRVRSCHSGGAPVGFGWGQAPVAPNEQQYGHIGPHDGGFCVNGGIIIPPSTNFSAVMQFQAVQTLNTNNLPIQVSLYGVRYRKVG